MTEIQTIELNSLGSTYDTDRGSAIGNEVKVTVLPPGEACGARDLQRWSKQRLKGQAGVPLTSRERKLLKKKPRRDAADRWLAAAGRRKKNEKSSR
jgi:hypothetical protein